jgi:hypothetical protein
LFWFLFKAFFMLVHALPCNGQLACMASITSVLVAVIVLFVLPYQPLVLVPTVCHNCNYVIVSALDVSPPLVGTGSHGGLSLAVSEEL